MLLVNLVVTRAQGQCCHPQEAHLSCPEALLALPAPHVVRWQWLRLWQGCWVQQSRLAWVPKHRPVQRPCHCILLGWLLVNGEPLPFSRLTLFLLRLDSSKRSGEHFK